MNQPKAKTRWILVAGSGTEPLPQKLADTSRQLGRDLADAGFGLVTGGWPGVDHLVSRTFAEAVKETRGLLTDRLVQFVQIDKTPDFPSGRFFTSSSDPEAWEASISKADAIVLVGGLGGTYGTGRIGMRLGKPVLPLADTREGNHSDAANLYQEMFQYWNKHPIKGLTVAEFQALSKPAPGVTADLIRLLGMLFGKQPQGIASTQADRQPNRDAALELWREKLDYLLNEERSKPDPMQKLRLKKEIRLVHGQILALEGSGSNSP